MVCTGSQKLSRIGGNGLISLGNANDQINISDRAGTITDPKIDILYKRLRKRKKPATQRERNDKDS
jgi:hypothetical protein